MLPKSNFGEVEEFESSHREFIGKAVLMAFGFGHSLGRAVTMMSVASESRLQFAMFNDLPKPCDMLRCDIICLGFEMLTIVNDI